jgi:xanthine/uracil permease
VLTGLFTVILVYLGVIRYIRRDWSPLILGSMVLMIGLTIAGVGLPEMTSAGYGPGFFIGLALALGGTILAIRGRGVWATLPPVLIIGLGYIIFFALGKIDMGLLRQAPMLSFPALFPHGLAMPPWDLILIMLIVNLMAAANMYGNIHGFAEVIGEKVSELSAAASQSSV